MPEEVIENKGRAAIYENFRKQNDASETKENETQPTEAPAEKGDSGTQPVKTEEAPPAETTGDQTPPGDKGPAPAESKVPLAALHAERERRKALEGRVQELENQSKTLLDDLQALTKPSPAQEPVDDYEKAILDLRKQNEDLRKEIGVLKTDSRKRSEYEQMETVRKSQESLNQRISSLDVKLGKQGYPGFARFKTLVAEELAARVRSGEPQEDVDTPENWEEVYKSTVFPQVREMFIKEKFDEKERKKKDANLVTGSGSGAPKSESKEDPWTYDSYMKMRQGRK